MLDIYRDAACIAVDMPIGLAEGEPRQCDVTARKLLGRRGRSVFPAADARVVEVVPYAAASARLRSLTGKGISKQAFAIYDKTASVNRLVTTEMQNRVIEVHPELSFWAMEGMRPMSFPKRDRRGFDERLELLVATYPDMDFAHLVSLATQVRNASRDDVLDAAAATWTARRHVDGTAGRVPVDPPRDQRGLSMEMAY